MSEIMVTPKFLSYEIAKLAVETVLSSVMKPGPVGNLLKRHACHIVILVPSRKEDPFDVDTVWPDRPISPKVLYRHSVGDKKDWSTDYEKVAESKSLQLWQDRNDDRTDIIPHLLFPGEAPFFGGVKRSGIVVACSGVQSWFDRMISGMICDMLIGMTYDAWMKSEDRQSKAVALT